MYVGSMPALLLLLGNSNRLNRAGAHFGDRTSQDLGAAEYAAAS
jgi:hypothetical protein